MVGKEKRKKTEFTQVIKIDETETIPNPTLSPCLGAILQTGLHCNCCSFSCRGYGH